MQPPHAGGELCRGCMQREEYRRTGDPSAFGGRAYCTRQRLGALCVPGRHAKNCPKWVNPALPKAAQLSAHEQELQDKLRDAAAKGAEPDA